MATLLTIALVKESLEKADQRTVFHRLMQLIKSNQLSNPTFQIEGSDWTQIFTDPVDYFPYDGQYRVSINSRTETVEYEPVTVAPKRDDWPEIQKPIPAKPGSKKVLKPHPTPIDENDPYRE